MAKKSTTSTSKKTTAKKAAPAKKAAAKKAAPKKAAPKKAAPKKAAAAPKKAATPSKKVAAAKKGTPARKPASSALRASGITTVVAKIDVGWGNNLYIRGEGAGLSWNWGIPLECSPAGDEWVWTTTKASGHILLKVLVNDVTWSTGGDICVAAGDKVVFTPEF